jgi:hypothetical protein
VPDRVGRPELLAVLLRPVLGVMTSSPYPSLCVTMGGAGCSTNLLRPVLGRPEDALQPHGLDVRRPRHDLVRKASSCL